MVSRKINDERGVFVSDMAELQDRLNEAHCTLETLVLPVEAHDSDLARVVEGVARMVRNLSYDFGDVEEVLIARGAIVTAEEAMEQKRAADAAAGRVAGGAAMRPVVTGSAKVPAAADVAKVRAAGTAAPAKPRRAATRRAATTAAKVDPTQSPDPGARGARKPALSVVGASPRPPRKPRAAGAAH